jgi:hypothetical protein
MKTLIVTGVHQAEAEFGERAIEKYKELYGVPNSVKIFAVPENKGSNPEDKEKERIALEQVIPIIREHKSELVIDIRNGFNAEQNNYFITVFHDGLNYANFPDFDALNVLFIEKGIQEDGCHQWKMHKLIMQTGVKCIGLETKIKAFTDLWSAEKQFSGQALYDFLAASAKKNNKYYDKAVEHTAKVAYFLHTELPERFPFLFQSTLQH